MYRITKIRIYPNSNQKNILNNNYNGIRFVRNKYIEYINKNGKFIGYKKYSKILNQLKRINSDYTWLVDEHVSTKAISDALHNEEIRWCRYFRACNDYKLGRLEKEPKRPWFISKKYQRKHSMFIIKDSIHYDGYGRRIISLPILGKVRISEPISHLPSINLVTSGYITLEGNKYYLCIRYKPDKINIIESNIGIGVDLGIRKYATIAYKDYDNKLIPVEDIDSFIPTENKDDIKNEDIASKYKLIQDKIIKLQQVISHKAEINYGKLLNQWLDNHPNMDLTDKYKNIMKGESYNTSSIRKIQYKINRLKSKLVNIRKDFIYKLVNRLVVITKQSNNNTITIPKYITIEGLSIKDMTRNIPYTNNNHKLHKLIQDSGWYMFAQTLKHKCDLYDCELRVANQYYPSSKTCCRCGHIKEDLKLKDTTFICNKCGNEIDRDENAAINLVNLNEYTIA